MEEISNMTSYKRNNKNNTCRLVSKKFSIKVKIMVTSGECLILY